MSESYAITAVRAVGMNAQLFDCEAEDTTTFTPYPQKSMIQC